MTAMGAKLPWPDLADAVEKSPYEQGFWSALVLRVSSGVLRLAWHPNLWPLSLLRNRHFRRRSQQPERHGLEVLHDGGEMELVACAGETSQPHALEAVMSFQVGKAHLDPFPFLARFQERLSLHFSASNVAGSLVHVAHDPARGHATLRLERALTATRH